MRNGGCQENDAIDYKGSDMPKAVPAKADLYFGGHVGHTAE